MTGLDESDPSLGLGVGADPINPCGCSSTVRGSGCQEAAAVTATPVNRDLRSGVTVC